MIVDLILLKNRNFSTHEISCHFLLESDFALILFCFCSIDKLSWTSYFGRIFRVPEVCVSYRLLQIVLFLTDSVFRVLFAYFDESMASKLVYKP